MRTPRMWRADDLGGLELYRATLTEFAFRPHAHEEFFIALTEDGLCTPAYRGDRHVVGAGDLIVLNPEEAHAGGPPPGSSWSYRSLYVRPEQFGEFVPHFRGDVIRDGDVAARLGRFHQLSERRGSNVLERESLLAGALGLLASRHAPPPAGSQPAGWRPAGSRPAGSRPAGSPSAGSRSPGSEPAAVRLSREYLEEHAAEQVTLQALARIAGLSPSHLCRVFAAALGMPPHAYQTQARIRRARSLLRTGLPISQVAAATGFSDQAHLTRHFKRIVGLTPGRYVADL